MSSAPGKMRAPRLSGTNVRNAWKGSEWHSWWLALADLVFIRESEPIAFICRVRIDEVLPAWRYGSDRLLGFSGESAIANGWSSRARATGREPAYYERAWLEMREAAFVSWKRVEQALTLAAESIRLAEEAKGPDLEVLGRSIQDSLWLFPDRSQRACVVWTRQTQQSSPERSRNWSISGSRLATSSPRVSVFGTMSVRPGVRAPEGLLFEMGFVPSLRSVPCPVRFSMHLA